MKRLFVLATILLVLGSCSKEADPKEVGSQPVLFEYEFVNHAWIYTHFGWMIDSQGDVRGFYYPGDWRLSENGYITKDDLEHNLNQTDTLYTSADYDKMLDYFKIRQELAGARIDTADQYMADAGVGTLYIYFWDETKNAYQRTVLASRGDVQLSNKHPNAKSIVNWLEEIGNKTDRFIWNF